MSSLVDYVADTMVNDLGFDAPDAIVRYHGRNGAPPLTVTSTGLLSISWDRGFTATDFPSNRGGTQVIKPGAGFIVDDLAIRFVQCWPKMTGTPQGLIQNWVARDAQSAALAELQDGITRALFHLTCAPGGGVQSEAFSDVFGQLSCRGFQLIEATPIGPTEVAGVLWRVHVIVIPGPGPS